MATKFIATLALVGALSLPFGSANAQQPQNQGNQGVGAVPANPQHVEVPERGSLPAAGGATQSAAPGMAADCQRDPKACSEPVTQTGSTPPSPGLPTQSK
jgi:hypothetical protein